MTTFWMVRNGRDGESIEDFLKHNVVALGWAKLGSLAAIKRKEEVIQLCAQHYPEMKEGTRGTSASQLMRFLTELKTGDAVVTYDRDRRLYLLGEIASDYAWSPKLSADKPHARQVKWQHQVPRDALSPAARNTLGAIQTLFKLSAEVAKELTDHRVPLGTASESTQTPTATSPNPVLEEEGAHSVYEEGIGKADEFTEDAINALSWQDVQELVAGILRAMGYRTSVAAGGSDRGVDIFASPDGLGLQEPRIFVEVKHREQAMSADKIRAFLGGRRPGDKCLYVSTGSFTKDARYEAERSAVPITLIDLQHLRRLLVDYYEKLDPETRALVPLRRLYWPVR